MILDIWFTHDKGPYYIIDDSFDSVEEAEAFWRDTPFLISVEHHGKKPSIVKEALATSPQASPRFTPLLPKPKAQALIDELWC